MRSFHSEFNWTICCSVNHWDVAQMEKFPDRWAPYMWRLDEANCPNWAGKKGLVMGLRQQGPRILAAMVGQKKCLDFDSGKFVCPMLT